MSHQEPCPLPHVVCPSHWAAVGNSCLSAANTAPRWVIGTSHSLTFTLSCERKKQDEDIGFVCGFVCAACVFVLICAASHVHVCVPYESLCVHILGTHSASLLTGPGAWSCSSFPATKLPQKATKNFTGFIPLGKF